MARKFGLGKGLDALLPPNGVENKAEETSQTDFALGEGIEFSAGKSGRGTTKKNNAASSGVVQLAVDKLSPNPDQPRKYFDEAELTELANSIAAHGVIQPIIAACAPTDADKGGETYIIIAGERRTRAARLAGLTEIPAIIRSYTDQKRMEISLVENIQRTDLNPIEEAAAYKNLMDFSGLSQDELAAKVGKNRSTVANALRLLKLPANMQKSLETGILSAGHARALLSVNDSKAQEKLYQEIAANGISVRETEKRAATLNDGNPAPVGKNAAKEKPVIKQLPEIADMEQRFITKLGTKVVIEGGLKKGRIHIDYYSMEDLERLYDILDADCGLKSESI